MARRWILLVTVMATAVIATGVGSVVTASTSADATALVQSLPAGGTTPVPTQPADATTPAQTQPADATTPVPTQPADGTTPVESPPADNSPVRPQDPPIGVPIQTLSGDADGAIRIDDQPVKDTRDRNGIFVAVLDRRTRAVVESGTVPRGDAGMAQLNGIADKWSGTDGYLMIVSGVRGSIQTTAVATAFNKLAMKLGSPELTAEQRDDLRTALPFSIIGIPGGASGSAWVYIADQSHDAFAGNMSGYLQLNTATNMYNFVSPQDPTFNTDVAGAPSDGNIIEFNGAQYRANLPAGSPDGFQLLVVDPLSGKMLENLALPTDTQSQTHLFADELERAANFARVVGHNPSGLPPLVFVQSIGHPKDNFPEWDWAANEIDRLGGNRLAFLQVDGTGDYSLVGGPTSGRRAVEAGAVLGQPGPLIGVVARDHHFTFQPVTAGPPGSVNTELVNITYQPATTFPAFGTPGPAAAETYIGIKLKLCPSAATTCPIRAKYYTDFQGAWQQYATDLNSTDLNYPGDGHGFTADEYGGVRTQLQKEFSAVNRVRTYFAALQGVFEKAGQQGRIDLDTIGNEIYRAVSPPGDGDTTSYTLGLIGKIATLGAALPPPANAVAEGIAASFAIGAYITQKNDTSLADAVRVKANSLTTQLRQRMIDSAESMTNLTMIIVSDYGKLTSVADKLTSPGWALPGDLASSLASIGLGAKQWFAEQLVPVAYPWLVRGTPPPVGPTTFKGLSCSENNPYGGRDQYHPWSNMPAKAEMRVIQGWGSDKKTYSPTFAFAHAFAKYTWTTGNSPPASLADLLFDPVNERTGTLGLNHLQFLSPRFFGPLKNANDTALRCDL
jgi:hypothetical protein